MNEPLREVRIGQKKARLENQSGYESLGRGCLKGTLYVHCTIGLCKCEKNKVCCKDCNRAVEITDNVGFSAIDDPTAYR